MESRKYFYELVDNIPEDKLEELERTLLYIAMPEVDTTEEDLKAFEEAEKDIANGDFVQFSTYEEMASYFLNDNIEGDEEKEA